MSEEDKAGTGEAPPEGESQEDKGEGGKKPDENRIPLGRVKEMMAAAVRKAREEFSAEMAPLIEAARASNQAPAAKPAQDFTKAQLAEFVEAGRLTQDAADQVWENQLEARLTRKATEAATSAVANRDQQRTVQQQMAEFQELVPEAWEDGSPERDQVAGAFRALKAAGIKGSKDELELAALIAAFGEPAKLRKARGFGRSGPAESFEDSGATGNRGSRGGDSDDADTPPKGLTAAQLEHYSKRMGSVYKNWSEVREELKYASKRRRA